MSQYGRLGRWEVFKEIRGDRNDSVEVKLARIAGWADPTNGAFGGLSPSKMMLLAETDVATAVALIEVLIDRFEERDYVDFGLRFGSISAHALSIGEPATLERRLKNVLTEHPATELGVVHRLVATEAGSALKIVEEINRGDELRKPPVSDRRVDEIPPYCFRLMGQKWQIRFGDESGYFNDFTGFRYIGELLERPNKPISALNLTRRHQEFTKQELLTKEAHKNFARRAREILSEIEDARKAGDTTLTDVLGKEAVDLPEEQQQSQGLSGRGRSLGSSSAEKARLAVKSALARAYDHLLKGNWPMAKLKQHLKDSIHSESASYVYRPATTLDWVLS